MSNRRPMKLSLVLCVAAQASLSMAAETNVVFSEDFEAASGQRPPADSLPGYLPLSDSGSYEEAAEEREGLAFLVRGRPAPRLATRSAGFTSPSGRW